LLVVWPTRKYVVGENNNGGNFNKQNNFFGFQSKNSTTFSDSTLKKLAGLITQRCFLQQQQIAPSKKYPNCVFKTIIEFF